MSIFTNNNQQNSKVASLPGKWLLKIILSVLFSFFYQINVYSADIQNSSFLYHLETQSTSSLNLPSDVTVDKNGRIYVVDGGNHRIAVFNPDGSFITTFGTKGSLDGQFLFPLGISSDLNGRIYVADSGNFRIQVFDEQGKFLHQFLPVDNNIPIKPVDIAISPDKETLYVTGNNNHSVMVFNSSGKLKRIWGSEGTLAGEFKFPATLAVTANGSVCVVDVLNGRIQIFEANGKLNKVMGSWGVLAGQFYRPKGIAVDKAGNLFVSDSILDVVEVFNKKAKFKAILGSGKEAVKFVAPAGIVIDDNNRLYVTEMLGHRVSVYQLE